MALDLRLTDADRERLGLPEWITYDPATLMFTEAELLQTELDIDPWDLAAVLRGTPITNDDGTPVMRGDRPRFKQDLRAWRFIVWIAARRAGCQVGLADFDANVLGLITRQVQEAGAEDDPKDPSTPGSENGETAGPSGP